MINLQRTVYIGGLVFWTLSIALFPRWIGYSYMSTEDGRWHTGGIFELEPGLGGYSIHPIWRQPRASTEVGVPESETQIGVRWPFQTIRDQTVIEMFWFGNLARLSLGIIILGAVARAWNLLTGSRESDSVISMAWSLALGQLIAWPCLYLSGVWMMSFDLCAAVLGVGLLVGLVYAVFSICFHAKRSESVSAKKTEEEYDPGRTVQTPSDVKRSPVSGLSWFTLGLFIGLGLFVFVMVVADRFRGPVSHYNTLMYPVYVNDQTPVYLGAGVGFLAISICFAILLRRFKRTRGLLWGLLVATAATLCLIFYKASVS